MGGLSKGIIKNATGMDLPSLSPSPSPRFATSPSASPRFASESGFSPAKSAQKLGQRIARRISGVNYRTNKPSVLKGLHKHGKFAVRRSIDIGKMMDPAPLTFSQNTPIDRVYNAFTKMHLAVVGIVSSTTNEYMGIVTRHKIIEYAGIAHTSHEKEKKSWRQRLSEYLGRPQAARNPTAADDPVAFADVG